MAAPRLLTCLSLLPGQSLPSPLYTSTTYCLSTTGVSLPPHTSVHRPLPVPSTSQPHLLSTGIDINVLHVCGVYPSHMQLGSSTLPISSHCRCSLCLLPGTSTPVSHHRRGDAKFLFCAVQVPARLYSQC